MIDTFRAFSTAAYLVDRGVDHIVLTETLDEARARARSIPGSILCGEVEGRRPEDFDLGNSPGEVQARDELSGRTVVLRTSAGTRCLLAAFEHGARPVFAASLVVASATAQALATADEITIVASGRGGTEPADEDEATADLIADLAAGADATDARRTDVVDRIRTGPGARQLEAAEWAHPDDIALCLRVDAFPFAMGASRSGGAVELIRVEI